MSSLMASQREPDRSLNMKKRRLIMKLIIAITGILICVGTASASPLAAASSDAVVATDLSSRKLTEGQLRSLKPAKRIVARPALRRIAR
jgi:hypothetical protein